MTTDFPQSKQLEDAILEWRERNVPMGSKHKETLMEYRKELSIIHNHFNETTDPEKIRQLIENMDQIENKIIGIYNLI